MCSASSDQNIRLWPREKKGKKKEKSSHNSGALLLSDNMVHCSAYRGVETHLPGSSEIKKCWCCWGKKRAIEVFWGIFRWLVSEASALCLTSIFCSEREKGAAMSVLPLPVIPALLCCWCLLAESEGGEKTPFLALCSPSFVFQEYIGKCLIIFVPWMCWICMWDVGKDFLTKGSGSVLRLSFFFF